MDGPEMIKITLHTKFKTSHYYQLVPVRQKLFMRSHQEKFTKLLSDIYSNIVEP